MSKTEPLHGKRCRGESSALSQHAWVCTYHWANRANMTQRQNKKQKTAREKTSPADASSPNMYRGYVQSPRRNTRTHAHTHTHSPNPPCGEHRWAIEPCLCPSAGLTPVAVRLGRLHHGSISGPREVLTRPWPWRVFPVDGCRASLAWTSGLAAGQPASTSS
ncbi:hypothetical protein LX36DRAFT_138839 [Colletotrichum falcatum]|nr:hypothetical protein LX36DRAFT_138839 [Colletotrichum falcatum]